MSKKPDEMTDTRDVIKSGAFGTAILASHLIFGWLLRLLARATQADDVWYNIINIILSFYTVISITVTFGFTLIRIIRERAQWAFGPLKEGRQDENE